MQQDKNYPQCASLMELSDSFMCREVYLIKSPVSTEVPGTLSIADDFRITQVLSELQ